LKFRCSGRRSSAERQRYGYAISLSLTVLGVSGLLGIWIAGLTVDSHPRRSLLITTAAIAVSMLLLPFVGGSLPFALALALALMTVWGAGLGAIGIYNQSAILRAGRENKDAANGLTVIAALLVTPGGRKAAYQPAPSAFLRLIDALRRCRSLTALHP